MATSTPAPSRRPTPRKFAKARVKPEVQSNDPVSKLQRVESYVNGRVYGRQDLTRGIVLSLIAGQNVLALGVPGTAKTMLVQAIAESFTSNPQDVFDVLLTKFTKASEVFGPTDMAALEQGTIRVDTAGYLPSARVGILDEVFKGSSAILNALLRIANERTFRNGAQVEHTKVRLLVGMSNEFPEDAALLAAFFDRFPAKFMVGYLEPSDFAAMLAASTNGTHKPPADRLTDADFAEIDRRVQATTVPDVIIGALTELRAELAAAGVVISDRRWVQAVKLMRASAVYDGRNAVSRRDLMVLYHVAWNSEADQPALAKLLPSYLSPMDGDLKLIIDECYAARQAVLDAAYGNGQDDRANPDVPAAAQAAAHALSAVRGNTMRLEHLKDQAESDEDRQLIEDAESSIAAIEAAIKSVAMGKNAIAQLAKTTDLDV